MFETYKPLRNYLRQFNLWGGLGVTYHYMRYLQFGGSLPAQLMTQKLRMGASSMAAGLHGHLVELLLRELILNTEQRGGKPFNSAQVAFKAMNLIHKIDGASWASHSSRSDDIILHLSRIAFKQFPWQDQPTNASLGRYYALYSHPLVAPMVEAEFGMSAGELFQLILLLAEELQRAPTLPLVFLGEAEGLIVDPVWALYERLSNSAAGLRAMVRDSQVYDVNWGFSFNPVRKFPLVHAGNTRSVMCPAPPMLMQRLTDGLYFDLMQADRGFGSAVGKAFEDYVGHVIAKIGNGGFDIRGEECWGKPERRSIDWIVSDAGASLFVECKLGRLDVASQTQIADPPPFAAAIERIARAIGQAYATLADALAGKYPHWSSDGRPIYLAVATFHEWFAFGPFFHKHLDPLVATEFERRGLDPSLREQYPCTVCSVAEFEGLLVACRANGIDRVLSAKLNTEHRQWLMRGFLGQEFPGCLNEALTMLDDGMDAAIHGPSRLTRL